MGRRYSTARVSKRLSQLATACLRARYCTNLAWSDLPPEGGSWQPLAYARGTVPILLGLIYRLKAELQPKQLSARVAYEYQLARPALWRANAVEETRLDVGSGDHAGVGHWREHND